MSVEDVSAVTLELASGAPVSLSLGWVAHIAPGGTGGRGSREPRERAASLCDGRKPAGDADHLRRRDDRAGRDQAPRGKPNDWENLWRALRPRSSLPPSWPRLAPTESAMPDFGDGLRGQCVIDAILTAAATRSWVDVDYPSRGSPDQVRALPTRSGGPNEDSLHVPAPRTAPHF